MLLAVKAISQTEKTIVALDIGTNTEISLFAPGISNPNRSGSKLTEPGRLLSCSCASGPAFEGAHIQDGMRAVPGAIEHVQFRTDKVYTHTIANQPPIGLCGSGILDAVAELYRVGILDSAGRLRKDAPSVRGGEYLLIDAKQSGHGKEVVVTRKDINEIQLAKGAIRAGVDVLLNEMNIDYTQIDDFIIAGAFGTYLDVDNAVRIGMFPPLSQERFHQVGNAAGMGAKQLLLSHSARQQSEEIARLAEYIELTTNPHFSEVYVNSLNFIKV